MKKIISIGFIGILIMTISCSSLPNKELARVAKDWSLVIRASQVIPVYPLSEDVQPGDVLLVSTPIEEQVEIYEDKGFLPLDQLLVRVSVNTYKAFYDDRYGIIDQTIPPKQWQEQDASGKHHWSKAPIAGFPSYQFEVRTGSGFNLAIPIEGVPFALGLMNTSSASGTVIIKEAHTYGMDIIHLWNVVNAWACSHRSLLGNYEPQGKKHHYLRVISRVYVTSKMAVTIHNDETTSGEAAAGADRPVDLLSVERTNTAENYANALTAFNNLLEDTLPGAKIKITSATSRTVTMDEEFDRPIVLGYVGFDLPILKGGRVGPPISTLSQLTGQSLLQSKDSAENVYRLAGLTHMYEALVIMADVEQNKEAEQVRSRLDTLDALLPSTYPFTLYEVDVNGLVAGNDGVTVGSKVEVGGFRSVTDFIGYAQTTVDTLDDYLKTITSLTEGQRKLLNDELMSAKEALRNLHKRLNREASLMEAIDFVFLGI